MKNKYLINLIKKIPSLTSGRKNYKLFDERIEQNIKLIKKMLKSKDINEFIIKQKTNKINKN